MRPVAVSLAITAVLAVAPRLLPDFYVSLLNYIGLFSLVTLGLVLLTGVAGITSFGQAAFVGLGAYTSAVLTTRYGISPWLTLLAGVALTAAFAAILGALTLRLGGHYLPLSTMAWGLSLYFLFGNLDFLGGQTGLDKLPPLHLGPLLLDSQRSFYYLIWGAVLGSMLLLRNLLDSREGRAIRALKRGNLMAQAFGVDTARAKTVAFVLAAVLAAVSGWLYAHLIRYINPTPFGLNIGIEYLFMAVIGGANQIWGAVAGAAVLTLLKQALQNWLPALIGHDANYEMVVFGVLMVLLLQRSRDGLIALLIRLSSRGTTHKTAALAPAAMAGALLATRDKPAAGEVLLRLKRVRKTFGGLVAVDNVSFEMRTGEILGLIGPNGAGKSTTFNLITGVLAMTSGSIVFREQAIGGMPMRRIVRHGIARTFQHVNLIADMSVLDNVALGAYLRGRSGVLTASIRLDRAEEASVRAEAMRQIERVGLSAHRHELAGGLALGQQRLLEIARALAADPVLLLLDEPAAGLRFREKADLRELLQKLRAEGISILLVEHDMDLVMKLVDRLVVMDSGHKLAEGPPLAIQNDPQVLEAYLGA